MSATPEQVVESEEPSLLAAARATFASRSDPRLEVDMRIAAAMSGVFWLAGGLLGTLMLPLAPPDRALGSVGWAIAAGGLAVCVVIGLRRLRSPLAVGLGTLFLGALIALALLCLVEWLAGGRMSPYHHLYALPLLYAVAVQPRRRVLIVLVLVCVVVWAPMLYAPARGVPAEIVGQILLLVVLGVAGRVVLTLLRAQRAGLREARRRAEELAREDPLTGLGNRRGLEEVLGVEVARSERQGTPLSMLVGDLDSFKQVNDALGHPGGDECLRQVARALTEASRTEDRCFRWGGDEFVVVLPDTSAQQAEEVRRRLCSAASAACRASGGAPVRLTCGAAERQPGQSVEALLRAADEVLFRFKRSRDPEAARPMADAPTNGESGSLELDPT